MAARYTRSRAVTLPRLCPGRFGPVARKKFVARRRTTRVPSFLLPSIAQAFPPFILTACISRTYTAFVTRLWDYPLARLRKIFGGGPAGYITNL